MSFYLILISDDIQLELELTWLLEFHIDIEQKFILSLVLYRLLIKLG